MSGSIDLGKNEAQPRSLPRVAVVAASFPPAPGGAEIFTFQLCRRLAGRGVAVTVFTAVQRPVIPAGASLEPTLRVADSAFPGAWFSRPFLRALRVFGRSRREYDLILCSMVDPNTVGIGVLHHLHRAPPYFIRITSEANLDLLDGNRLSPLFRWAVRRSAGVIVMNRAMSERVARLKVPSGRIHRIPNGVDCAVFRPASVAESAVRTLRVGYMGRLVAAKGADLLLRAAQQTAGRFCWRVVGAGPLASGFQKLAAEHGGIDWREQIPHSAAPEFYRGLDIFVLPSRDEGMSNALLEAMASGLPCLVSDIPANRPFSGAVRFFRAGSAEELLAGLHELASASEVRRALGERARRLVESEYSIDKSVGAYANLFESVMRGGNGSEPSISSGGGPA